MENNMELAGIEALTDKIIMFCYLANEYGKPVNNIESFVEQFYDIKKADKFKVTELLDREMQKILKDTAIKVTGGYKFYFDIAQQKFETPEEMTKFIEEWTYRGDEKLPDYTIEDFNANVIGINGEELKSLALMSLTLLLEGVPGTGKTVTAYELAQLICGKKKSNRIKTIQFNSSYCYADFIEEKVYDGKGTYTLKKGELLEIADKAQKDLNNKYVLIIDEMSRGSVADIIGPCLTLMEKAHRNKTLPTIAGTAVSLPKNLIIIGTMNRIDKSTAAIDTALRQRFPTYTLRPIWGNNEALNKVTITEKGSKQFKEFIAKINDSIDDPEYKIGNRSLFHLQDGYTIQQVFDYDIMPLLRELFELEPNVLKKWIEEFYKLLKKVGDDTE